MIHVDPFWRDHSIAARQPFVPDDFTRRDAMIDHLSETVAMPPVVAEPVVI